MRIFVTGPTGSGKSTLAAKLSQHYGIPSHALDDIHWVRHPCGDQRRPLEAKLAQLQQIVATTDWIIEGVQFKWADAALERADLLIVIDSSALRTATQILLRFCKQRLGMEPATYKPTLKTLMRIFGWSRDYRREERALLLNKLEPFTDKTYIIKHSRVPISLKCVG